MFNDIEKGGFKNEKVQDLKFFTSERHPNAIYLKFSKDGQDYCVGMNKDLEKHDITIIDESINRELLENVQYLVDIPPNSEDLINLAVGEIEFQEKMDSGGDVSYE